MIKTKWNVIVLLFLLGIGMGGFTSCNLAGDDGGSGSSSSDGNFTLEGSGGN